MNNIALVAGIISTIIFIASLGFWNIARRYTKA